MEGHAFAGKRSLKIHNEAYHTERGTQRRKRKEEAVHKYLESAGYTFDRELWVNFCGSSEKRSARLDFVIYRDFGFAVVEVDEDQHKHEPISCETRRMMDVLQQSIQQDSARRVHFIRFNPDTFQEGGEKQTVTQSERRERLRQAIEHVPTKPFEITYLFYDRTDSPLPDVCFDEEYPQYIRALVNINAQ